MTTQFLKRFFLGPMIALMACTALAPLASAQTFPTKAIRIVVPFGAGGVADLTARTVAQKLSETLGQSVVVDNKPGPAAWWRVTWWPRPSRTVTPCC